MSASNTRRHDRPTNAPRKRALAYLRVSSAGQVNTDYDPEGLSLPAQRTAIQKRAAELGADIVEEYVEPGRSATTTDRRPRFQDMMARIKAEKDVDYVIVYARSRLHRNSIDAAITKRDLKNAGAVLISVMDYTEDSAIGDLVATVLDGVNEYQSRASGADIAYKMGQKVKNGGAIGRAPLGYLNVREKFEGREVRTIAIDPQRAPLVKLAFELYATGTYTLRTLREALTDAGFRARETKRSPAGTELSVHKLGTMLRDRFYIGFVSHKGSEYPGRHEPLIERELFDKVQSLIDSQRGSGSRARVHHHYLKGMLFCDRCHQRLIVLRGKSHTGALYFYYYCRGRQEHQCGLPLLPVQDVEDAVLYNYVTVGLPAHQRERIVAILDDVLNDSKAINGQLRAQLNAKIQKLDRQEDQYLDLIGDPDWPQEKLSKRLRDLRDERARITRQLDDSKLTGLEAGSSVLLQLIDLLTDPQELYRLANEKTRRTFNELFFKAFYLDTNDDNGPYVAADEPSAVLAPLVELTRPQPSRQNPNSDTVPKNDAAAVTRDLPAPTSRDVGLSKASVVELRGLEPLTFCLPDKCSTN